MGLKIVLLLTILVQGARSFAGLQYLGNITGDQTSSNPLELWLSNAKANQTEAEAYCSALGSKLLHILTRTQDENVRYLLLRHYNPEVFVAVWTSGSYNSTEQEWYWASVQRPLTYFNWLVVNNPPSTSDTSVGLAIIHFSPTYGWISTNSESELAFICMFE